MSSHLNSVLSRCQGPLRDNDTRPALVRSMVEPSRGTFQWINPSVSTVPVFEVTLPGRRTCRFNANACCSVMPWAAMASAYGVAPTAARRSGSVNDAKPCSTRAVPVSAVATASLVAVRLSATAFSGPSVPLMAANRAVACSGDANGWRNTTTSPPLGVGDGPSTIQPAERRSSSRRSVARPGALFTNSASAAAVSVTVPLPFSAMVTSMVASTRHALNTSAQTMTSKRVRMTPRVWHARGMVPRASAHDSDG